MNMHAYMYASVPTQHPRTPQDINPQQLENYDKASNIEVLPADSWKLIFSSIQQMFCPSWFGLMLSSKPEFKQLTTPHTCSLIWSSIHKFITKLQTKEKEKEKEIYKHMIKKMDILKKKNVFIYSHIMVFLTSIWWIKMWIELSKRKKKKKGKFLRQIKKKIERQGKTREEHSVKHQASNCKMKT